MSAGKESLNLTAMIDMMTILLIFLLVQYASMSFTDQEAVNTNIPRVSEAGEIEADAHVLYGEKGLTDKDGNAVDLETLKDKKVVSLQVEKTLKMKQVLEIQTKLQQLGVNHIELAVIESK